MFKGFLKKIWSSIIDPIVKRILGVILGSSLVVVFKDWIWKHLTTTHTADIPLWGWITIIAIIAGVPLIVVLIIEWLRKPKAPIATSTEKPLTNPDDIINSLHYWLHEQTNFLGQKKVTRWYFSKIDNLLKLVPGSEKEYLSEAIKSSVNNFRIEIVNEGEKTILVRFCHPQIL